MKSGIAALRRMTFLLIMWKRCIQQFKKSPVYKNISGDERLIVHQSVYSFFVVFFFNRNSEVFFSPSCIISRTLVLASALLILYISDDFIMIPALVIIPLEKIKCYLDSVSPSSIFLTSFAIWIIGFYRHRPYLTVLCYQYKVMDMVCILLSRHSWLIELLMLQFEYIGILTFCINKNIE